MKKIQMFVYNDLKTDARVMRTIETLSKKYELVVYSIGEKKELNGTVNITFTKKYGRFDYYMFMFFILRKILFTKSNYVYGHDYYACMPIYILMKLKKDSSYIYDAHELLFEKEDDLLSKRQLFFLEFENKIINKVDQIISASKERSFLMKEYYHLDTLPLTINNVSILPKSNVKVEYFSKLMDSDAFKIVYAGVVSKSREIDKFIQEVIDSQLDIQLFIIGNGDFKNELIEKYDDPRVIFIDSIPYNQLRSFIEVCDAGFLNYPMIDLNNTYCASNKVYEYASVGISFLYYFNPTIGQIASDNGIGFLVQNNLSEIVNYISQNKQEIKNATSIFISKNNWSIEEEKLISVFKGE